MRDQSARRMAGGFTLALFVVMALVYLFAPAANARFKDAAAALTFITGAAIAIERVIEGVWTFVGGVSSGYWPLKHIRAQVNRMEDDLDTALAQVVADTTAALQKAGKTTQEVSDAAADLNAQLLKTQAGLQNVRTLAPDSQRAQMLATLAAKNLAYVQGRYPDAKAVTASASTAIDGLQDFVASFKDNPGRRMISLYLGAMLGLAVAGAFGLDVFEAAMQAPLPPAATTAATQPNAASAPTAPAATTAATQPNPASDTTVPAAGQPPRVNPQAALLVQAVAHRDTAGIGTRTNRPNRGKRWQIILTGLIMGLGSSPTHEVIRAIQEYKKSRKGVNVSKPDQP
jgi:hypothetical protein